MARAACNDKFQDQARSMSGVVLEFDLFGLNLTFLSLEILTKF